MCVHSFCIFGLVIKPVSTWTICTYVLFECVCVCSRKGELVKRVYYTVLHFQDYCKKTKVIALEVSLLNDHHPNGLVVHALASTTGGSGFTPVIPVTYTLIFWWLPCQTPDITGSVLRDVCLLMIAATRDKEL